MKFLSTKVPQAVLALIFMGMTAFLSIALKPSEAGRVKADGFDLETTVPKEFGDWKHDSRAMILVVNPETKALLDKIYSQIIARTYVNSAGHRVMLSIAYGSDQRGALQAHKPEVCYPAQGFLVGSVDGDVIETPLGRIDVTRMTAVKVNRSEPVTYWFTVGDQRIKTVFERRILELKSIFTGQIPDGLLFRVSSIGRDSKLSFEIQDRFINELLSAIPPAARARLAGL
jgi:EpsI family protein